MDGKIFSIFLAALLSVEVSGYGETYRGAVVEYHPVTIGTNAEMENTKNYEKYMTEAKLKGADIIVFPEGGLFGKTNSPIPDPVEKIAPCTDKDFKTTEIVKALSCASKKNAIYSVVNLREKRICEEGDKNCPLRGYYIFNTNVVFDPEGVVIARYAKYNLFSLDTADQPPEPEMGFFDTNFGVRFGMFICFDILFPTPALKLVQQYHITDFVFPTYWFSETPFLTALQAQRGWAETNNVKLLASGINIPHSGSSGSGIFNGKYGHLVQLMTDAPTSKLLVTDIPKIKQHCGLQKRASTLPSFSEESRNHTSFSYSTSGNNQTLEGPALLQENLYRFASEIIKAGEKFERKICTPRNFCCDFKIKMDAVSAELKNYTYRAVVFNGARNFGVKFRGGAEVCGVVVCNGPNIEDCGKRTNDIWGRFKFMEISIVGNFKRRNSLQIPSTLTQGDELTPLSANKYEFTKTEKDGSMEVSLQLLWPVVDLNTFAIWGRDFTRDNEPSVPESNAPAFASMPLLFAAFVFFVLFVR